MNAYEDPATPLAVFAALIVGVALVLAIVGAAFSAILMLIEVIGP